MTAPGLDQADHITALTALLATPEWPVYERGEVPGLDGNPDDEPSRYLLLDLERRYIENARLAGLATRSGWRLGIVVVGSQRTEVRAGLRHVTQHIEGTRLQVGPHASTPIHHESTEAIKPDDHAFSADVVWTYTL